MNIDGPKERATFSLSPETKGKLDAAVPKSQRSQFVEVAIERALRDRAVASMKTFLDDLPRAPAGGESLANFLRRKRMEWDGRPIDILEGNQPRTDR
ncbi:MAG: hypothetical protein KF723_17465 [Rhizobiaceae bacterium]|nr:hypothetical protein [Rhizobiaceae bacterium]